MNLTLAKSDEELEVKRILKVGDHLNAKEKGS